MSEAVPHDPQAAVEYMLKTAPRFAIEAEETFRFKLKAAELHVEIWRSKEASNRAEGRATQ